MSFYLFIKSNNFMFAWLEMVNYQSCMACENERFSVYVDEMRVVFKEKVLIVLG